MQSTPHGKIGISSYPCQLTEKAQLPICPCLLNIFPSLSLSTGTPPSMAKSHATTITGQVTTHHHHLPYQLSLVCWFATATWPSWGSGIQLGMYSSEEWVSLWHWPGKCELGPSRDATEIGVHCASVLPKAANINRDIQNLQRPIS